MGYFPFFIDIENKKCVVVGGGTVAQRKIEKLMPFNPRITVVAPEICDEIMQINGVEICRREFKNADIEDAFMVISATDNPLLNAHIFELCKTKNILINTVDDKSNCGFIFPALIKKKNITVGISTSGKSPLYARFLRENIERTLDENCDETVEILDKYRRRIKTEIKSEKGRKTAFERILNICIHSGADEEQIEKIIEELK